MEENACNDTGIGHDGRGGCGDVAPAAVYIAPVDTADGVFIGTKTAAKLAQLFHCHADTPLEVVGFNRAYEGGVSYFSRYGVKKQ